MGGCYKISDFENNLAFFKNKREVILISTCLSSFERIENLSDLAIESYKVSFKDFSLETFNIALGFVSKTNDFYECKVLLKTLNQTDFSNLINQLCEIIYCISENYQGDLTDKLLLKLKFFEISNSNFREKLDSEILAILFNHAGEFSINHSLSDSLPVFLNYLIKNKSIEMAKGILIEFEEYLIEIVDLMIFENEKCENPVNLKDFYQIIIQDEIGTKKYSELELLICKL